MTLRTISVFCLFICMSSVARGQVTSPSIWFQCSFEDSQGGTNLCGMIQDQTDDKMSSAANAASFDWQRGRDQTPTLLTGPERAQDGTYYIFIETSDPLVRGSTARITTPALGYTGAACVDFYYHMYGSHIGSLQVYTQVGNTFQDNRYIGTVTGQQGNQWNNTKIDVNVQGTDWRIGWAGTKGPDFQSDMALDNIFIRKGACSVSLPLVCDFEQESLCSFTQLQNDQFDWTRNSGSTATQNTGPTAAFSGSYYLYIEASAPRQSGDRAIIESPSIPYTGSACLQFNYHMYGSTIGQMQVYNSRTGSSNPVWSQAGNKDNTWLSASVNVNLVSNDRIGFIGTRGNDIQGDISLDNFRLTAGVCEGTPTPTPTPVPPTERTLPYSCGFETDFCGMYQRTQSTTPADQIDWRRQTGATGSEGTGPSSAFSGSWYMYIEASSPAVSGQQAFIETPQLRYTGMICVSFYYHMYGSGMGRLSVITSSRGDTSPIWQLSGNRGNQWTRQQITTSITDREKVILMGEVGSDITSDVSIDAFDIRTGSCEGTSNPGSLPYMCTFEVDFCNMVQRTDDNFDWTRQSGRTLSDNTGPDTAQEGSWYAYGEASSPRVPNDRAALETPPLQYTGDICVMFYYHMYGSDIGSLAVYLSTQGSGDPFFRRDGNQGNQWIMAMVDVSITNGNTITFLDTVGRTAISDAAIDNLSIRTGRCSGSPTPAPTPTPTPTPSPSTNLPLTCTFEDQNICGMTQTTDDNFDWTRNSGSTDSEATGPTGAQQGTFYMYIEASSPRRPNERADLQTPMLQYTGSICVRFYYHMYGNDIGRFDVFTTSRSTSPFFSRTGAQGNEWVQSQTDTTLVSGDRITFRGVIGGGVMGDISLDNLSITIGSCSSTPTPTPTPAPSPDTTDPIFDSYTCNTEGAANTGNNCRLRQDTSDNFQWSIGSETTPSGVRQRRISGVLYPVTGPQRAYQGTRYIYTEATGPDGQPRRDGDIARLIFEGSTFQRSGSNCLRFWFNMNGFHMGMMRVYVRENNGERQYRWMMEGDMLQNWRRASVDINMNSVTEMGLEGIVKGEFSSDMAIDDIQYTSGRCDTVPVGYLWRCNFESSDGGATLCDMRQSTTDTFDWKLWRGSTPSQLTGPSRANSGDFYIYIEASSPRRANDQARILIPRLNQVGTVCVEYYYNMYGFHTGRLEVYTERNGFQSRTLATVEGEKGSSWIQGRTTVENLLSDEQIGFRGVIGNAYSGDIGLDNVQVRTGSCNL